jgi:hypothetical protein
MPADLLQIVLTLIGAGAVYGGIRADMRNIRESVARASATADSAHRRIDDHIAGEVSWRQHSKL